MNEQGIAILVFFGAFALLILVLSWDADHDCQWKERCPHRRRKD